jgi:CubicO group peptidase (beta-lactamase class C family)
MIVSSGAVFMIALLAGWWFINEQVIDKSGRPQEIAGMRISLLEAAAAYAGGSGIVMRGDRTVYTWGDISKRYDLKSTTKSFGATVLGLAIKDGLLDLDDSVIRHYPAFGSMPAGAIETGWIDEITYRQLATHTAGFDKPGGYEPLLYRPGEAWAYSDGGANWLADALTYLYRRDLNDLLFERVFERIGILPRDLTWRDNRYRDHQLDGITRREFGAGIHANVQAMAKIGLLYLWRGNWHGQEILPEDFVDTLRKPLSSISTLPIRNDRKQRFANAPHHYGLLWWNNGDGAVKGVPEDAFWSWGLYDSLIVVIPSLDIVAVRAGDTIPGERSPSNYQIFGPFLQNITASVNYGAAQPNSPVISNLRWEEPSTIIRQGAGSDNWPVTWGSDNLLYSSFGDGRGFEPYSPEKLSLGFARVEGTPPRIQGINIRSDDEQYGAGPRGKKSSGMLMVNNILYMWVRNATDNATGSQLAWSHDFGKTWQWSSWIFHQFGYCTFINFGCNYDSARDKYVYTVTHDNPSAYERADRFILMRVRVDMLTNRNAYTFFKGFDAGNKPVWTKHIDEREAVFVDPGRCHRSGISYNAFVGRYFWWQGKFSKGTDGRHESKSFGIFDAPEPWGPWTTVYFTEDWDVATGETGNFPTKWISDSGLIMHLVFSGNDSFSVRKATLSRSPVQ